MKKSKLHPSISREDKVKYAIFRAVYCEQTDSRDNSVLNFGSPSCWNNARENEDLAPIYLTSFTIDGVTYRFRSEFVLRPFYDESQEYICVQKKEHSLFVYAQSKAELIEEIYESYAFLWEQYALAEPEDLSPQAQLLAKSLKKDLEIL